MGSLKGYGKLWGQDPFKLWSRRWEYPFAAAKTIEYGQLMAAANASSGSPSSLASSRPNTLKFIDAGSGVTFFPYFVCDHLPQAEFICIDSNPSYPPMFDAINRNTPGSRVSFANGMLQKLEMPNASIDGICCISVLEHTDNYGEIVREFARVLKTGGLLLLTFDLSLDGKFELRKEVAADLLSRGGIFRPGRRPCGAGTEPHGRSQRDSQHRSCETHRTGTAAVAISDGQGSARSGERAWMDRRIQIKVGFLSGGN